MKKGMIMAIMVLMVAGLAMSAITTTASASPETHRMQEEMGHFNYTNGVATGTFVSFKLNPENGEISDYALNGTVVFQSVTYENVTKGDVSVRGATLMYMGTGAKIDWSHHNSSFLHTSWMMVSAHDGMAGVLHIVEYGYNKITYTLAPGETAKIEGNNTISIEGKISGELIHTGKAELSGNTVTITMGSAELGGENIHGGSSIFVSTNGMNLPGKLRDRVMEAMAKGKLAGEIKVNGHEHDFVNYTYGFHAQVEKSEKNRVQVKLQADFHEGKVVMVELNKSQMSYDAHHRIMVKLDGKEINEASESEVLSASGTTAEYAVVDNGNTVTLLVYVPHFSEHTLDVESQAEGASAMFNTYLIIGAVAAVIIVAVAVILIKR